MLKEDGPYGLRRSSITFAKWVVTAGAIIRGTKRFFFIFLFLFLFLFLFIFYFFILFFYSF